MINWLIIIAIILILMALKMTKFIGIALIFGLLILLLLPKNHILKNILKQTKGGSGNDKG